MPGLALLPPGARVWLADGVTDMREGVPGLALLPPGARVWLADGVTDMREGVPGLALLVQEGLGRDPHAGDLHVFRGRSGSMVRFLWHDGVRWS